VKVFYCWQSDRPDDRNLIEDALNRAVRAVAADGTVSVERVVDRDTRDIAGAPDIAHTIFEKIRAAAAVVADVTIIHNQDEDACCNQNVLVEAGFAMGVLGSERVILVMNVAHGRPESSVRHRVAPYS
jgi:hypothetical protein